MRSWQTIVCQLLPKLRKIHMLAVYLVLARLAAAASLPGSFRLLLDFLWSIFNLALLT